MAGRQGQQRWQQFPETRADDGDDAAPRLRPDLLVVRILVAGAVVLAALSLGVPNLLPIPALSRPDSQIRQFVASADEQNLPTWFNVVTMAHAATLSAGLGLLLGRMGRRDVGRAWVGLAAVLALLSLDDLASLHERLEPLGRDLGGGSGALHFAWIVPGLALGALVMASVAWLAGQTRGRVRRYLLQGVALLIGSALGLEAVNGLLLSETGGSRAYVLSTTLEELLETIGAALLACAPLAAVDLRHDPHHGLRLAVDAEAFRHEPRHVRRTRPPPRACG